MEMSAPEDSDRLARLTEDLELMAELKNPHREGVLELALEYHAARYGPNVPLNMYYLNKILATYGQPLATLAEVNAWYGDRPSSQDRN